MIILTWVLGCLGGISALMGIITATESIPELADLPDPMTPLFWMALAIVLMLGCIATLNSRPNYD